MTAPGTSSSRHEAARRRIPLAARARTATAAAKPALWKTMTAIWPPYVECQQRTAREIPVVIIERA